MKLFSIYSSVSSSDIFNDPKKTATPSGWTWDGQTWVCADVNPSEMGTIPTNPDESNIYKDLKPLTEKKIQKFEFNNIFDILKIKMSDTGITNHTAENINYTVQKTDSGMISGGIKIVGFKNQISINNHTYTSGNNSTIVKYEVVKTPSLNFVAGGVEKIDKTVDVKTENGTAYATLTVKMKYYTVSKNQFTGKTTTRYKISEAMFKDSALSPDVLTRPTDMTGSVNEYTGELNPHTLNSVPSKGLTKVAYDYDGNVSEHVLMIGERATDKNGVKYTNFSTCDYWRGDVPYFGNSFFIKGPLDPDKLKVTAYTPYENFEVTDFKYTLHEWDGQSFAGWVLPFLLKIGVMLFVLWRILRTMFS